MMCEDSSNVSRMSVGSGSASESSPFKLSPVKLLNNSWYDEIENSTAARSSMDIKSEIKFDEDDKTKIPTIKIETTTTTTDASSDLNFLNIIKKERQAGDCGGGSSSDHDIAVEFLDVSNEEKYERLVKEEKIKYPFKRRLSANSNEGRSVSPVMMTATTVCGGDSTHPKKEDTEKVVKTTGNNGSSNLSKKSKMETTTKRRRDSTGSAGTSSSGGGGGGFTKRGGAQEMETNEEILSRRQKQIDYGKNTVGYDNYIKQVSKRDRTKEHPWTPNKRSLYSRRAWDGLVKVWRKKLHVWDPSGANNDAADMDSDSD